MAFEHVTFFEVNVDGTAFGSPFGGTDETDDDVEPTTEDVETDAVDQERPGGGRKRRYVAFLGLITLGSLAVRRLRRRRVGGDAVDVDVGVSETGAAAHEEPVEQ